MNGIENGIAIPDGRIRLRVEGGEVVAWAKVPEG